MSRQDIYLVDLGVLLEKGDDEFDSYNMVYDKKYGYYDYEQYYTASLERAMSDAKEHLDKDGYYAVISKAYFKDDIVPEETPVEGECYEVADIVYSARVEGSTVVENFVEGQSMERITMEQMGHDSHDR